MNKQLAKTFLQHYVWQYLCMPLNLLSMQKLVCLKIEGAIDRL